MSSITPDDMIVKPKTRIINRHSLALKPCGRSAWCQLDDPA
jgi:hypothetical protein